MNSVIDLKAEHIREATEISLILQEFIKTEQRIINGMKEVIALHEAKEQMIKEPEPKDKAQEETYKVLSTIDVDKFSEATIYRAKGIVYDIMATMNKYNLWHPEYNEVNTKSKHKKKVTKRGHKQ